jgi:hypothetical protein
MFDRKTYGREYMREWRANLSEEEYQQLLEQKRQEEHKNGPTRWRAMSEEKRERRRMLRRKQHDPKIRRNGRLKVKYGVTLEQWNELFERQGKCCAFCKTTEPGNRYGWHTDHCHEKGRVRWILCHPCNLILGHCKENMDHLRMIIAEFGKT